jgi:AAA ATPase domain
MTTGLVLVGRVEELATAGRALFARPSGHVLIIGTAGIGKTTLLDALAVDASERGYRVRRSRPAISESDLPFAGLHDLVSADLATFGKDLPGPLRRALDVALLRVEPPEHGQDALAVDLAVLGVLEATLDHQPQLLVLDDVQWLDAPTRRVLAFALRRLVDRQLAVVAALRGEDEDDGIASVALPEHRVVVRVGPLSIDEIADVVGQRTGRVPTPGRARSLHHLSGGNPYLAVEIARSTVSMQLGDLPVPARRRTVLGSRLSVLSEGCRRVLLAAALLARPRIAVLDQLGCPGWLAEAEGGGVVRRVGDVVEFDHPLLAATTRELADPAAVVEMHRELAELVDDVVERARHLALAAQAPDQQAAAEVEAAARVAYARAAAATAAELARYSLALTAADALDDRVRRAVAAANWCAQTGENALARDCVQPLLDTLPPGPDRARCLWAIYQTLMQEAHTGFALCQEALAQPGLDSNLEVQIRLALSRALVVAGDLISAHEQAASARARAEATGPGGLVARAAFAEAETELLLGHSLQDSVAWTLARRSSWTPLPVYEHPDRLAAFSASWSDDNSTAVRLLAGLIARAREHGDVFSEFWLTCHLAEVQVRLAQTATASELAEHAYRLWCTGDHDQAVYSVRGYIAALRGDAVVARTLANEGLRMAEADTDALFAAQNLLVLGFTEVSCGNLPDASRYAMRLRDLLHRMQWGHPGTYRWHADAVEALLGVGRLDDAAGITAELWEQSDRLNLRGSRAIAARS